MPPNSETRRRGFWRGRGRTVVIVTVIVLIVLATSLKGLATFYTDFLWFRSLSLTSVWRAVLLARVVLALIFIGLFFALCWLNLFIADRVAPAFRPPGPEEELLEPYHAFIGHRVGLVRLIVSFVFAVIAGAGVSSQWNSWILFTHRVDFGIKDPQFHKDVGFYVFQLPFLSFVINWLFFAFVMIFLITTVEHYLNGGIRLQTSGERITPQVKAHLSSLLAVLALVKVGDYWLGRYQLTTSSRGVVDGATYTDVKVQLPALELLVLISLLSVVLLLININRRGWQLPAVTVGLWALVAIVVGTIYPAFVQRFSVEPAQSTKERAYVERNIGFTRNAYGLADVKATSFDYTKNLSYDSVVANINNLLDARILDPEAIRDAFQREQGKRTYYQFPRELDVDRYMVDGKETQVVIGTRELKPNEQNGWENAHLAYTHGNGLALAAANEVTDRGLPKYLIGEVPPTLSQRIDASLTTPQIYFSEDLGGYAIVNASGRDEVDYTDENEKEVKVRYSGDVGVKMGSLFRRAAFAIRFGQIEPLISNLVDGNSRIIYNRDVLTRVKTIAPFLKWDTDPYPVVDGGRVVYIIDGYTTTNRYPYSQHSEGGGGALSGGGINYVRNSVKAVVDAYTGIVHFYRTPIKDPIIEAYSKAFPGLFEPYDALPAELKSHLRYPQDLFKLQTTMWSRYHISDPAALLSRSGQWSVAQDAPREVRANTTDATLAAATQSSGSRAQRRVDPYYEQITLPGETKSSFVGLRTFVPYNTDDSLRQLTAFMVADSSGDPAEYGRLKVYEFTNSLAPGPAAVAGNIVAKGEISQLISLLNQQGSNIEFGDLLLIPIDDSLLYVRPLFVKSKDNQFPALNGVVVSLGDDVALGGSLQDALEKLFNRKFDAQFGGKAPSVLPPGAPGQATEQVKELLAQLQQKQADAEAALKKSPPDFSEYGRLQGDIRDLISRLAAATGLQPSSSGGTSGPPSTSARTTTTTTLPLRPASA